MRNEQEDEPFCCALLRSFRAKRPIHTTLQGPYSCERKCQNSVTDFQADAIEQILKKFQLPLLHVQLERS